MADYQGPVPLGANEGVFRATGKTVPNTITQGVSAVGRVSSGGGSGGVVEGIEAQKAEEAARLEAEKAARREAISGAYDPIFAELDRQLGGIPGQQTENINLLDSQITSQKASANFERDRALTGLDQSATLTKQNASKSIRDLENDIRNQIKTRQFYFGALGAGDSSAPMMATDAIAGAGQKARGDIYVGRDQNLNQIELKKADVNAIAGEQIRKIDQFKTEKLFEITQFFQEKVDRLNSEKANATATKLNAINNEIFGLENEFRSRLYQLDDTITQYKSSVAQWGAQRAAALDDENRQLAASQTPEAKFDASINRYNALVGGGLKAADARKAVAQYDPSFLNGISLQNTNNLFQPQRTPTGGGGGSSW